MNTSTVSLADAASFYASVGLHVFPLRPKAKIPATGHGFKDATSNPEKIATWWNTGPRCNLGCNLGASRLVIVDCDSADAVEAFRTLYEQHSTAATLVAKTRNGCHVYFATEHGYRWPRGAEKRLRAACGLTGKLDLKGDGGYSVLPPSQHPDGGGYRWVNPGAPILSLPGWLTEIAAAGSTLVETGEESSSPVRSAPVATAGIPPGDDYNQRAYWPDILAGDGWTFHHHTSDNGHQQQHWTRPGKDRHEGTSAVTNYQGNGCLHVFTSSTVLEADRSYSKFGYWAAWHHQGDHSAAARDLARRGYGSNGVAQAELEQALRAGAPRGAGGDPSSGGEKSPPSSHDEPRPRLKVRTVSDILRDPPRPDRPYLDGYMNENEKLVIGAPRALGKTWFGFNLALTLAAGRGGPRFLDRFEPVCDPLTVIYSNGELSEDMSHQRWSILTGQPDPTVIPGETEHIFEIANRWSIPVSELRRPHPTIPNASEQFKIAAFPGDVESLIESTGADALILDPWAMHHTGNENSNQDAEAITTELDRLIRHYKIAVAVIHHFRGNADFRGDGDIEDLWRGATRLPDWASTRTSITPHYTVKQAEKMGMTRQQARRFLDLHFLRRGTPVDNFSVKFETGRFTRWIPEPDPDDRRSATTVNDMIVALAAAGGRTPSHRELADIVGVGRRVIDRLVVEARNAGLVHTPNGTSGGGRGQPVQLTAAGDNHATTLRRQP